MRERERERIFVEQVDVDDARDDFQPHDVETSTLKHE